jgi:peptide/nickel transport system permease protein
VLGYVIRRTAWAGVLFLVLTAFTFVIFFVVPGAGRQVQSFRRGSELRLRDEVKLQGSIVHQYAGFVKAVVTHGSLGHSYYNRQPVNELVLKSAQVTAALVLGGMLIWLVIAIPIGILSALRPRSLLDRGGMVFVLIGIRATRSGSARSSSTCSRSAWAGSRAAATAPCSRPRGVASARASGRST